MRSRAVPLVVLVTGMLAALVPCGAEEPAALVRGGHFRYATIYWRRTSDMHSNTVEVTIESAWRRDYSSTYFTAALGGNGETLMKINGKQSPAIDFGDGTDHQYLEAVKITAYSEQENWFLGSETFTHTYDTPNDKGDPWVITFSGCCRMGNLQQGKSDQPWEITASLDLLEADASPQIVSLPVIHVKKMTNALTNLNATFNLYTSQLHDSIEWSEGPEPVEGQYIHPDGTVELDTKAQGIAADCSAGCHVNVIAYCHFANGLSIPVDLMVNIVQGAYPEFLDFPPRQTARLGFELTADIKAFQNASAASGLYVGFTVGTLPNGLHLSTVRGKGINRYTDPAIMTLRWTPCAEDLGSHVVCVDAVNNHGLAATQQCLVIDVVEDEAPSLTIIQTDTGDEIMNGSSTRDPLMMGLRYTFNITAHDSNGLDALQIYPVAASDDDECSGHDCIPPTAVMSDMVSGPEASVPGSITSYRLLTFAPKHDHGGYEMMHCFSVSDSCGSSLSSGCGDGACPGSRDVNTTCMVFTVKRCEMVVREGQQLQQIAAIYGSDWLQLWSHNQNMLHPDMELTPHQVLHIGHLYDVQPFDKPLDVAKRFGMDRAGIWTGWHFQLDQHLQLLLDAFTSGGLKVLNADLGDDLEMELCSSVAECNMVQMCILPNSCTGMSSSIYHTALKIQGFFAGGEVHGIPHL